MLILKAVQTWCTCGIGLSNSLRFACVQPGFILILTGQSIPYSILVQVAFCLFVVLLFWYFKVEWCIEELHHVRASWSSRDYK